MIPLLSSNWEDRLTDMYIQYIWARWALRFWKKQIGIIDENSRHQLYRPRIGSKIKTSDDTFGCAGYIDWGEIKSGSTVKFVTMVDGWCKRCNLQLPESKPHINHPVHTTYRIKNFQNQILASSSRALKIWSQIPGLYLNLLLAI